MSNPLDDHWTAVKRILKYFTDIISYRLHMQPDSRTQPFSVTAMSDLDWASEINYRRSTSGSASSMSLPVGRCSYQASSF